MQSVAIWAGVGAGTVDLIARRVLRAVHSLTRGIKNKYIRRSARGSAERRSCKVVRRPALRQSSMARWMVYGRRDSHTSAL